MAKIWATISVKLEVSDQTLKECYDGDIFEWVCDNLIIELDKESGGILCDVSMDEVDTN